MKKGKKPVFFIVLVVILAFATSTVLGLKYQYGDISTTYINGLNEIRLGIDIQGGVDATFVPVGDVDATEEQLDAATEVMKLRLATLNINDSEVYSDADSDRIIVRFPWQAGESEFDPEAAVAELGETAVLTFRYVDPAYVDSTGYPTTDENGNATGEIVLQGTDIVNAGTISRPDDDGIYQQVVTLELSDAGKTAFSTATGTVAASGGRIAIWMDNTVISAPTVDEQITLGTAEISGNFTYESAKSLADKINSGALPFSLETTSFKTISPTLGTGALNAMILSGLLAFAFIAVYMIVLYRLPGFVAVIGLIGQVAGTLAAISGWFGFMDSSTLTIPGIAGIILAVGMGVDANIITAERIKEELHVGKSLDAALRSGYKRAFSSILDGNLTVIIVAIILMGAFGVPTSFFARLLKYVFIMFGATTEGVIYSFGYTLMVGVILNFLMGVLACRLMLMSLSAFKAFRNKKLYGGESNA